MSGVVNAISGGSTDPGDLIGGVLSGGATMPIHDFTNVQQAIGGPDWLLDASDLAGDIGDPVARWGDIGYDFAKGDISLSQAFDYGVDLPGLTGRDSNQGIVDAFFRAAGDVQPQWFKDTMSVAGPMIGSMTYGPGGAAAMSGMASKAQQGTKNMSSKAYDSSEVGAGMAALASYLMGQATSAATPDTATPPSGNYVPGDVDAGYYDIPGGNVSPDVSIPTTPGPPSPTSNIWVGEDYVPPTIKTPEAVLNQNLNYQPFTTDPSLETPYATYDPNVTTDTMPTPKPWEAPDTPFTEDAVKKAVTDEITKDYPKFLDYKPFAVKPELGELADYNILGNLKDAQKWLKLANLGGTTEGEGGTGQASGTWPGGVTPDSLYNYELLGQGRVKGGKLMAGAGEAGLGDALSTFPYGMGDVKKYNSDLYS